MHMRKGIAVMSIILLMTIMISGGTMAWFVSNSKSTSEIELGTVKIKVIRTEDKKIHIKNLGTSDSYVRVRLIPQWSNPNLSVSNAVLDLSNENWTSKQADGYYYYKKPLKANYVTSNLLNDISIGTLKEDYKGETFTLKVVAEGVQTAHDAWKDTWGIDSLPFTTK